MSWFKRKKSCVHCRINQTKRELEGAPTCTGCRLQILSSRESERRCPVDGAALVKKEQGEILIDRCPRCEGIWLDAGELEAIREAAHEEGMGSGMAVGMVVG